MSSTYTTNKNLAEPALGDTSWNVPLNSNFTIVDSCLGSSASFTLSSSDVTLTTSNIQNARIALTGTLLTNINVIFPAGVGGVWVLSNFCTGNYSLTLKTASSGVTANIQGRYGFFSVFSDGTNIYLIDNSIPAGMIQAFGNTTAPGGWLICDGSSYSTSSYAALFASIGYTWGGAGASFNVPDLRGMFLRGTGTNGTQSGAVGPSVGAYQADAYLNHTHAITDPGHAHIFNNPNSGSSGAGSGLLLGIPSATYSGTQSAQTGITVNSSTTGGTETRSKNYGVLYCIKT